MMWRGHRNKKKMLGGKKKKNLEAFTLANVVGTKEEGSEVGLGFFRRKLTLPTRGEEALFIGVAI